MPEELISIDVRELFDDCVSSNNSSCTVTLTTTEIRGIIRVLNLKKYGQDKKSG